MSTRACPSRDCAVLNLPNARWCVECGRALVPRPDPYRRYAAERMRRARRAAQGKPC